ncbi:MAG: hypothetical protein ACK4ZY_16390, partial [Sphingomonas sp.]
MAETTARRGGLTIIPQDIPTDVVAEVVAWVKSRHLVHDTAIELDPTVTAGEALVLIHKRAHGAGVVTVDGRPVGIIERNAFTLRMAAEFGRALYAKKPAESLMDRNAPIAEASTSAETFFQAYDAAELGALLSGFVVVADGRYLGVGTALQVVQAGAALHRQRAEEMGALARDL